MITGKTRVVGIFGNPIEQTMSPYMHNAAFEALSLPWCYLPFNINHSDLEASVRSIIPLGINGVNITIPFKMKVIPFLDKLDRHAGLIGAVNTIEVSEGKLIGHNTDGSGFIKAFNEEIDLPISGRRFLIIGAGGAARAAVFALAEEGAGEIIIINRTIEKGKVLADDMRKTFLSLKISVMEFNTYGMNNLITDGDVIINTTSVGMKSSDPLIIPPDILKPSMVVCDLIYNPPETPLLRGARKAGIRFMNGLGMLLYQGALSFEIWTGLKAPVGVMREALIREASRTRCGTQ